MKPIKKNSQIANQPPSHAVANNIGPGGISLPAVEPLQLLSVERASMPAVSNNAVVQRVIVYGDNKYYTMEDLEKDETALSLAREKYGEKLESRLKSGSEHKVGNKKNKKVKEGGEEEDDKGSKKRKKRKKDKKKHKEKEKAEDATSKQEVNEELVYVEQDGYNELDEEKHNYHYIGQGKAYTTRVATCTALAIYDPETKYSFLYHADGQDAGKERMRDLIGDYKRTIGWKSEKKLVINLYAAPVLEEDEEESTSLEAVKEVLHAHQLNEFVQHVVSAEDTILVSSDRSSQIVLTPDKQMGNAIRSYNEGKKSEDLNVILNLIQPGSKVSQSNFYGDLMVLRDDLKENKDDRFKVIEQFLGINSESEVKTNL